MFSLTVREWRRTRRLAFQWTRKAAGQGFHVGQFNLGYCYDHGVGVAKDWKLAISWYRKAAKQGNVDAKELLYETFFRL